MLQANPNKVHPAFRNPGSLRAYYGIVALRVLFFSLAAYLLSLITDLGTNWLALAMTCSVGVVLGSRLAFSKINLMGLLVGGASAILIFRLLTFITSTIPVPASIGTLGLVNLISHLELLLLGAGFGLVSTFFFWRFSALVTAEIVVLCLTTILLFSGHRNYRFDTPQIINSLAWSIGWGNLATIILIGSLLVSLVILYLFLSTLPSRPHPRLDEVPLSHRGRIGLLGAGLLSIVFVGGYLLISLDVYRSYAQDELSKTGSGVGQGASEGMSPLGFHSALGSTNQPAALVRLEGDYKDNPFVPMLYLRESALSEFNGKEMVIANSKYDTDVPSLLPESAYSLNPIPNAPNRSEVTQSIYLLADHKLAFGIDFPISYTRLKNPNPGRFRGVYQAKSLAPAYKRDQLKGAALGDPSWDEETWKHYLAQHQDQRYAELAKEVTKDAVSQVDQAFKLASYLSAESIYTLSPNHEVQPNDDPVAPYLFGDRRGYCVHFAHAMTYMLRSLGIPARIGTGYLTDLSQAKDGHILLRMSDRHAWAEAYLAGYGWVPFDVEPTQVESHADSQIDMKLLEELMGLLEPEEEILPKNLLDDESNIVEDGNWIGVLALRTFGAAALAFMLWVVWTKAAILLLWKHTSSKTKLLRLGTLMLVAILYDLGIRRRGGETRSEFRQRLITSYKLRTLETANILTKAYYSQSDSSALDSIDVRSTIMQDLEALRAKFGRKILLAYLNPASVLARFGGALY